MLIWSNQNMKKAWVMVSAVDELNGNDKKERPLGINSCKNICKHFLLLTSFCLDLQFNKHYTNDLMNER